MSSTASRVQMNSVRDCLTKKQEEFEKMRLENPAICLPRTRYTVKLFAVAELEYLIKRQQKEAELMEASHKFIFSRTLFYKLREISVQENTRKYNCEKDHKALRNRLRWMRTVALIDQS